jgi:HK97 family phage major capsid protein
MTVSTMEAPQPSFAMQLVTREMHPDRAPVLVLSPKERQSYSLTRALECAKQGHWRDAPMEKEISDEMHKALGNRIPLRLHEFLAPVDVLQRRDLTTGVASAGGFLVESEVPSVIRALSNRLILNRLGVDRMTGLKANQTIARVGATATCTWQVTEATAAAETQTLSLSQTALAAKTVLAYIETSRQLGLMAPDLAEQTVRNNLAQALAAEIERVAFNGSGANGEPLGLLNTSGIGTFNGASITYANVLESQTDVLNANALGEESTLGYACRPAVASVLAQRQGFSSLAPLWVGPLNAGQIVGAPAFSSLTIPAATLVCGDFKKMMLAEWGAGVLLTVNPYANFQAAITGYQAALTMDVGLAWQSAFSVATSVS